MRLAQVFIGLVLLIGIAYSGSDRMGLLVLVVGLLALGVFVLFALKPKTAISLSILIILFGQTIENLSGISAIGLTDEAAVICVFLAGVCHRLRLRKRFVWMPGQIWLTGFLIVGVISSMLNTVPLVLASQGAFLYVKGFLFAFGVMQIDWTAKDVKRLAKSGSVVLIFVLIAGVVNLVIPDVWNSYVGRMRGGVQWRSLGLPSVMGPFVHPNVFGQVTALGAIAVAAYMAIFGSTWASRGLLAFSALGTLLSFRRKAFVGLVAGVLTMWLAVRESRRRTLVALLVALPLVLVFTYGAVASVVSYTAVEYFTNPGEQGRYVFYRDSIDIAWSHLPLGVGFARYGSFLAGAYYSPEYTARGYESIWGLGRGDYGGFLSDTFWPAVLGETGVLGLLTFGAALVASYKYSRRVVRASKDPSTRFAASVALAWSVEFFIESIAAPSYVSPPAFILFYFALGILSSRGARELGLGMRKT